MCHTEIVTYVSFPHSINILLCHMTPRGTVDTVNAYPCAILLSYRLSWFILFRESFSDFYKKLHKVANGSRFSLQLVHWMDQGNYTYKINISRVD